MKCEHQYPVGQELIVLRCEKEATDNILVQCKSCANIEDNVYCTEHADEAETKANRNSISIITRRIME